MVAKLPDGYTGEEARYVEEQCNYYLCVYWSPDRKRIIGTGTTPGEAIDDGANKVWEHYNFQLKNAKDILASYLENARKRGRFYDEELINIISILSGRLLER